MYIADKDEMKTNLELLQDALDYCSKWDAYHDDLFNEEIGKIQETVDEMKLKLKTV